MFNVSLMTSNASDSHSSILVVIVTSDNYQNDVTSDFSDNEINNPCHRTGNNVSDVTGSEITLVIESIPLITNSGVRVISARLKLLLQKPKGILVNRLFATRFVIRYS